MDRPEMNGPSIDRNMTIQGYPVVCNGARYNCGLLLRVCRKCPLRSKSRQVFRASWRISGTGRCIIKPIIRKVKQK